MMSLSRPLYRWSGARVRRKGETLEDPEHQRSRSPTARAVGPSSLQTVTAQVAAGHLIGRRLRHRRDGDAIDALPAQALVFPVRFTRPSCPFTCAACRTRCPMPPRATVTSDPRGGSSRPLWPGSTARRRWRGRRASPTSTTFDDILADGTSRSSIPRACPTSPTGWPPLPMPTDVEDAKLFIE